MNEPTVAPSVSYPGGVPFGDYAPTQDGDQLPSVRLVDAMMDMATRREADGHTATARRARFAARSIARYDASAVLEVTDGWIEGYTSWLREGGASDNTVAGYLKAIRATVRSMGRRGGDCPRFATADAPPRLKRRTVAEVKREIERWYCVRLRRKCGNEGVRLSCESYAPKMFKAGLTSDGRRVMRPDPVISRLLFVRCLAGDLVSVLAPLVRGVSVVRLPGSTRPAPVADSQLAMFRLVVDGGGVAADPSQVPCEGAPVEVTGGAFAGLRGYVVDCDGINARVTVRIEGICVVATPQLPAGLLRRL